MNGNTSKWTPALVVRTTIYLIVVGLLLALSSDVRDAIGWLLGHAVIGLTIAGGVFLALLLMVGLRVPKR